MDLTPEQVVEKVKRPPHPPPLATHGRQASLSTSSQLQLQPPSASASASRDSTATATVNSATSTTTAAVAAAQTFSARLQKLAADFSSLTRDSSGLSTYDDLVGKLARAESESRLHSERAAGLEAEADRARRDGEAVTRAFEGRFRAWDAEQGQRTRDVEELKTLRISSRRYEAKADEAAKRADRLRFEADAYKTQVKSLEGEVLGLKDRLDLKSIQWRQRSEEVTRYKDMIKVLQDDLGRLVLNPPKARDHFDRLATQVHDLIWRHFSQAIPDPAAPINVAGPLSRIPLVPSESNAARCMRCAFAEAVVAQQLVTSIFRDQYLVDEDSQVHLSGLFQSLEWLDKAHPPTATVIRCQMAKLSEDSVRMQALPAQAADSVREVLRPWLRGDVQRERELTEALRVVFYDALMLWKDLQRTSQRAEAFVELDGLIWDSAADSKPDYDAEASRGDEGHPSYAMIHPIAVLFPKIYVGTDSDECDASDAGEGDDEDVLYHGYALFHTQATVMAASKEWSQSQPYQRPVRRRASEHARRASSVMIHKDVGLRVNGIVPISPETSYSQRMAASQAGGGGGGGSVGGGGGGGGGGTRARERDRERDSAPAGSNLSSNRSQRSNSVSGALGGGR